jgi:hypothetical protein
MRQRGYVVAFVFVLLAACAGGFFGGRFLIRRLQQDFGSQTTWAPPTASSVSQADDATPVAAPNERPTSSPARSAQPPLATPVPTRILVTVQAPIGAETSVPEAATLEPTPTETETALPRPSPTAAFPFLLARSIRNSTGDCPGSYVLGLVTDRGGRPLPGVRLLLADEYNNTEFKVTKDGADAGRYDFPLFGPPRRFYLSVVDASGRPVSARVEIAHGVGADAQATCHWADWQRQ